MRDWPDESFYADECNPQEDERLTQALLRLSQKYHLNYNDPNHLDYWQTYANKYPTLFSTRRHNLESSNSQYAIPEEIYFHMLSLYYIEHTPSSTLNTLSPEMENYFTHLEKMRQNVDMEQELNKISTMSISEPPFPLGGNRSSPVPGSKP